MRAERKPHQIDFFQPQMVQQGQDIARQLGTAIGCWIMRLGALAMTAQIKRYTAQALDLGRMDPAGARPVLMRIGGKAMHQHQGIDRSWARILKMDVKTARTKMRHVLSLLLRAFGLKSDQS